MKKLYYRFGDVPQSERSSIWKGETKIGEEDGVSVYEAYENIDGVYSPVIPFPPTEKTIDSFYYYIKYFNGNKYLVKGDLLSERGSDGEPLLRNVRILKKL